jgi:hypothetical protein
MPFGFVAAAATVASGVMGANASRKAAKSQAQAAEADRKLKEEQYWDQVNRQEPFRQAGLTTQAELLRRMGLGGDAASQGYGNMLKDFSTADFQADPGYAFRLSEGLKALDRTAAMRGKMMSGQALKAAGRYGQDMASQEYQNAYNRYNQNRTTNYSMLTGQQAVGQGATAAQNAASQNYATGAGQAIQNAGDARASGYIGAANAWSSSLNNLTKMGMYGGFGG